MQTAIVSIVCVCVSVLLIVVFYASFFYGIRHLPPIAVNVTSLSAHDGWVTAYIISYILPLASMAIQDFNLILAGAIGMAVVFLAPFVNTGIPNPLLMIFRYHFYQIDTANGVSGYVLISRRKLRNVKEVKSVKRAFEFVLIDEERR